VVRAIIQVARDHTMQLGIEMISVKEKLPIPNTMCKVTPKNPRYKNIGKPFRFVTYSDGTGHFWDNLVDDILQDDEVTHWEEA
jgi:hypothetical protein